jgi:hypothetical protein
MAHRRRVRLATLTMPSLVSLALCAGTVAVPAVAEPDDQSAAAVIQQLRDQGYAVEVKGVSSQSTGLLTGCTVTSIDKPVLPLADPNASPRATGTVYVQVACPIHR